MPLVLSPIYRVQRPAFPFTDSYIRSSIFIELLLTHALLALSARLFGTQEKLPENEHDYALGRTQTLVVDFSRDEIYLSSYTTCPPGSPGPLLLALFPLYFAHSMHFLRPFYFHVIKIFQGRQP